MTATDAPIVMLTNALAPDKLGGLERYVRELAAGLVAAGRKVSVVTKQISPDDSPDEIGDDGVHIIRHAVPSKKDPAFAVKYPVAVARAVDRAMKADADRAIVHAHFVVPALAPALRRTPYFYTCHAPVYRELLDERHDSYLLPPLVQRPAVAALRATERAVLRRAHTVIALSDFIRSEIELLNPRVAERTVLVPGGIDLDRFTPDEPVYTTDIAGSPLLVAARRFTPRTGLLELVQAMPAVLRELPAARLVLLGDGGSRPAVEGEAVRLGLGDAVTFLGRVSDDDLVDWYRRADLVVMPTQALEGFGLSTAEALACGTPVVATPIGANGEIIRAIDSRLLARDCTSEALADAIVAVTKVMTTKGKVTFAARPNVDAYGWDEVVARHVAMYRRTSHTESHMSRSRNTRAPALRDAGRHKGAEPAA